MINPDNCPPEKRERGYLARVEAEADETDIA
jgi:hypothetical protein